MPILLVIDDERAIHFLFRQVFPGPDFELVFADSAQAGVDLFRQHHPHVVEACGP